MSGYPSPDPRLVVQLLLLVCWSASIAAQGSAADYQRVEELTQRWRRMSRTERPEVRWLADGVWWQQRSQGGRSEYVRVVVGESLQRTTSANLQDLGLPASAELLQPRRDGGRSGDSARATMITFDNQTAAAIRLFWVDREGLAKPYGEVAPGQQRQLSTYVGHWWRGLDPAGAIVGVFAAEAIGGRAVFDERAARQARARDRGERRTPSPFSVQDGNLHWRSADGERPLTTDGSAEDAYHEPRHWSPDRRRVLGFRVRAAQAHPVRLIESAPTDQLQPKLHVVDYLKPGDRIAESRPCLWDAELGRRIEVDEAPFANAWSIDRVHWRADGGEVYLLHNERGHQRLRVMAIDANTGAVRTVLDESSATFVDYSQKTILHWLGDRAEFLWASERDGWNHLYHVDAIHGSVRQVTRGNHVVRRIEHVDLGRGQIWFAAYGLHPGQDPYHLHLARVDLDGSNLTLLTQADGDHEWSFSPDRQQFVASWSRVDHPWVTELRRAADGALLAELVREDVAALLAAGFRPPERFVAKGRDGVTDIHGILILPSNVDPARRYPVIEDIYAGPHGQHVPKRWGLSLRQRALAELGFAVVQIDGMGTNWRHKAFHDMCWRNLADAGFPDRIAWLRALASTRPYLDLQRVGIFGGSAGGQNALSALLHHGDFYRVAVADCGCHDNRMDKIWWNEAWMGYPVGPWYAASSNVTHAAKLRGKLLLTVGELDRNVDPASTMQVVKALIDADRDFDLVVVPGGGHGVGESPYLVRRRQDFFVRHLHGVEPRQP
jgi:dipeptidyl aminopeptidase/acylaminoacyl peptidase